MDISGFSTITRTLLGHGQHGAEVLASVMQTVFTPLVSAVYAHDGFITVFAGDAFTALFPVMNTEPDLAAAACRALAAGWQMRTIMAETTTYQTEYESFEIGIKVGLAVGDCHWEIIRAAEGERATFYFRGTAVDAAAETEQAATKNTLLLTAEACNLLGQMTTTTPAGGSYWQVMAVADSLPAPSPVDLPGPPPDRLAHFLPSTVSSAFESGEFRQIISLFISLQGAMSDEQVIHFGQTLMALQMRYGGLLKPIDFGDKGCKALLFWGAPVTHENDVERAFNFILDLQEQSPVALRAGLTRRIALAGIIGSELQGEYTAYGDGVNLAARFMTAAPWGSLWLDEELARHGQQDFIVNPAGSRPFKGFQEPQAIYTLEGRQTAELTDYYKTPIIGREAELADLQAFIQPLFEGRFAGVLAIEGEAGLGKTRLVTAFRLGLEAHWLARQASLNQLPQFFTGQAEELVRSTLNPFRYWLNRYFDQSPDRSESHNKRAFGRKLDALIEATTDEDLARSLTQGRSFLGALVDLTWPDSPYEQLAPEGRHEWTFSTLKALLLAESLRRPVILLLEDIQWLDGESVAFLERLVRRVDDYPLAILVTNRPAASDRPVLGEVTYQRLTLVPLPAEVLTQLGRAVLGGPIDNGLATLLAERAEGNPFFAEQVLLYLRDVQGVSADGNGVWHLAETQRDKSLLPADVRVIFTARLDRLTQAVKEVVQTAAVLGREFEVQVLAEMLRDDQLDDKLHAAAHEAVWVEIGRLQYIFKHALLRDAAYRLQLRARRRELHQIAAEALILLHPEPDLAQIGEIAYHYERACQLGLKGLTDEAVGALKTAGQAATEAYDRRAAIDYYGRALDILPPEKADDRYELLLLREAAYEIVGDRAGQTADLEMLADLSASDPARYMAVILRQASLAISLDACGTAVALAQKAIALAQESGQTGREAAANQLWGRALANEGDYPGALERLTAARLLAETAGEDKVIAETLVVLGEIFSRQGEYDQAASYFEQALAIREALGNRRDVAQSYSKLGAVSWHKEAYSTSQKYYERALAIFEEIGDQAGVALALAGLGISGAPLEGYSNAKPYYEQALAIYEEIGDRSSIAWACGNLASFSWYLGTYDAAQNYYERAQAIYKEIGNRSFNGWILVNLGNVAFVRGAYDEAWRYYEQSEIIGTELGQRPHVGYALNGLAMAQAALGETNAALENVQKAIAIWQELGQEKFRMESQAVLADIYRQMGDLAAAVPVVDEVLAYLAQGGDFEGTEFVLRNRFLCYRILEAAQDSRAQELLQAAYDRLQRMAELITDPEARQIFIHHIPWHREIVVAFEGLAVIEEAVPGGKTGEASFDPVEPADLSLMGEPEIALDESDSVEPGPKKHKKKAKKHKKGKKGRKKQKPMTVHITIEHLEIHNLEIDAELLENILALLQK